MISRRAILGAGVAAARGLPEYAVVDAHAHLGDFRIDAPGLAADAPDPPAKSSAATGPSAPP